jgi:hypothetical protein
MFDMLVVLVLQPVEQARQTDKQKHTGVRPALRAETLKMAAKTFALYLPLLN